MMTRQEMLRTAAEGLAAQGFTRARSEGGTCVFRGVKGAKCAVGHIVSDELLQKARDIDDTTMDPRTDTLLELMRSEGLIAADDKKFLSGLQRVHDTAETPDQMKYGLKLFASFNDLGIPGCLDK